jgi:hypothetical protein
MANGFGYQVTPVNPTEIQAVQQGLSGLGDTLTQVMQQRKAEEAMQQAQGELQQAYESGDPDAVAAAMIKYPQMREQLQGALGFRSEATKRNLLDTTREILARQDDPQSALAAMDRRIQSVQQAGGDPSDTLQARNELASIIESGGDPSSWFKEAEQVYAATAEPQEWEAYKAQRGIGAGGQKVGAQEILPDGTVIQSTAAGPRVYSPDGQLLSGAEAAEKIRDAREYGVDISSRSAGGRRRSALEAERELKPEVEGETTRAKSQAALDVKAVDEALTRASTIREGLSTYDNMIDEIDAGASTSAFGRWGPSIKTSTRRFENEARKLGLGVISETTFGALSAPELELAMETAVPKLEPQAMKKWLQDKKAAQAKLADELERYAIFRGDGGSRVEWMQMQRDLRKQQEGQPKKVFTQEQYDALKSGAEFIDPDDGKVYRKP